MNDVLNAFARLVFGSVKDVHVVSNAMDWDWPDSDVCYGLVRIPNDVFRNMVNEYVAKYSSRGGSRWVDELRADIVERGFERDAKSHGFARIWVRNPSEIKSYDISAALALLYKIDPVRFVRMARFRREVDVLSRKYKRRFDGMMPRLNFEWSELDKLRRENPGARYISVDPPWGRESVDITHEFMDAIISRIEYGACSRRGYGVSEDIAERVLGRSGNSGKCEVCGCNGSRYNPRGAYPIVHWDLDHGSIDLSEDYECCFPVHAICARCNFIVREKYLDPLPDAITKIRHGILDACLCGGPDGFRKICSDYNLYFDYVRNSILRELMLDSDPRDLTIYYETDADVASRMALNKTYKIPFRERWRDFVDAVFKSKRR